MGPGTPEMTAIDRASHRDIQDGRWIGRFARSRSRMTHRSGHRSGRCSVSRESSAAPVDAAIFELRTPAASTLRADIRATVDAAATSLGLRPDLVLDGPIDSAVPDQVRPDLSAVLRESLSKVVKHARASAVEVRVTVSGDTLSLVITDNGAGAYDERSGLVNMREGAARHGGGFRVDRVDPAGTRVEWSVPLAAMA
jgi:hypothetical protein